MMGGADSLNDGNSLFFYNNDLNLILFASDIGRLSLPPLPFVAT
jgi:hypothetical protein